MFKTNKLLDAENEKLEIERLPFTKNNYITKTEEHINALRFHYCGNIGNDKYELAFALNCPDEVIMNFPLTEEVDIKKYIFTGETFYVVNGQCDIDPRMEITMMKYFNNTYIVNAHLLSSTRGVSKDEIYAADIEFEFNLNDYMIK